MKPSLRFLRSPRVLALAIPLILLLLFALLKGNRGLMDSWVYGVLSPAEGILGRVWSILPFSLAEVLAIAAVAAAAVWLVRAVWALFQKRGRDALKRLLELAAACAWVLALLSWMWNAAYYASTFTQRSGLQVAPYSVDTLAQVTGWFAQNAARLSDQMPRDGEGHFDLDISDCFARTRDLYRNLEEHFPFLAKEDVFPKAMYLLSPLQSALGFTGVYFPFTGEANVNIDAPACLIPATAAHEMSHQRMVSSELEANFVGIAACVTSDDPLFQYSGYLMGLIHLSNALYPVDPEAWQDIVETWFTPELTCDWQDNNAYWAQRQSQASDTAEQVYDAFLKQNGQELGYRSYGACVDLLVTFFESES